MMISQNIVIFSAVFGPFVTAVLGAAVDAKGSSASLLAPPVDVRTEANVKPSELFGNLDFSHGLFTDIAVTKTKEHRRISQIHCRDSAEFGITWLSFSYKDFHNTAGPDVPGIEKTGWDHGHQGSGRMHDKVLVFGDVITKGKLECQNRPASKVCMREALWQTEQISDFSSRRPSTSL